MTPGQRGGPGPLGALEPQKIKLSNFLHGLHTARGGELFLFNMFCPTVQYSLVDASENQQNQDLLFQYLRLNQLVLSPPTQFPL